MKHGPLEPLARALRGAIFVLAMVMLVVLSLQVVMRYVVGQALSWSEEVALTAFTWTMLLAIAVGVRDSLHVRMDLLIELLPAGARRAAERAILLLVAALGILIAWAGVRYVVTSQGITSAAIAYPIGLLYAAAPICGALIALFALERAWQSPLPEGEAAASAPRDASP